MIPDSAFVRVRLDLAYDGTDFAGWARQPQLRTVQGELESALTGLYRALGPVQSLVVAGRTDAGVHAVGQVAHLDLTAQQADKLAIDKLARSINGMLGASTDLVVTQTSAAEEGFDARFSAVWRRYEYRIADDLSAYNPIQRRNTAWYRRRLDVDAMDAAAACLVGLHDWGSFCKPRERATTIRTLQDFRWRRNEDDVLVALVKADAFCHSMIRSLVGACVAVGEGRFDASKIVELRDAVMRTNAFAVMPARGLTLMEVGYPDSSGFAARAAQTRAHRSMTLGESEV